MRLRSLLAPALTLTLVACSDDDAADTTLSSTTTTVADLPDGAINLTGESAVSISTIDNDFDPSIVVITAGTEVTFTNDGRNVHNVVPEVEGTFEEISSEEFQPGVSVTRIFEETGDIPYYCAIHGVPGRGQTGRIIVVGAS